MGNMTLTKMFPLVLALFQTACATVTYRPVATAESPVFVKPQILCVNSFVVDALDKGNQQAQQEIGIEVLNEHGYLVVNYCNDDLSSKKVDIRISSVNYLMEYEEVKTLWNVHSVISFGIIPIYGERLYRLAVIGRSDGTIYFDQTYKTYGVASWWLIPAIPVARNVEHYYKSLKISFGAPFVKWQGGIFIFPLKSK